MCHPKDSPEVEVPEHMNNDETELSENVPEDVIYVNENVFNQDEVQAHIVTINGVDYIFYVGN